MNRVSTRDLLVASDRDLRVARLVLHRPHAPTDPLPGQDRGARSHEGVEHQRVPPTDIFERVGHELDWLDCRVILEIVQTPSAEGVPTRISPYVRAITPESTHLDVVAMRLLPDPEHANELVLA